MQWNRMVWAWHVKEPSALHSFTSGSGRRHILWTFIDLLRKDAQCWTKPACLRGEIKYLYRTGREQKSKALLRPTLCRAFFTDLQASGCLASHTCRMGSVSLPISPDSEYFLHTLARVVIITCCLLWSAHCLLLGEVTFPPLSVSSALHQDKGSQWFWERVAHFLHLLSSPFGLVLILRGNLL